MIEVKIVDYLEKKLNVPTSLEVPENETKYIVVEKTGGSKSNYISNATIAVQSIAPSLEGAILLNDEVKKAMEDIVELDLISSCKLNTDYNFTDTTTKRYRYQAVFDIVHY